MTRTDHTYNATAISYEGDKVVCVGMIQVFDGKVFRSNGLWTGNNGTAEYHNDWVRSQMSFVSRVEVVLDGGACYKRAFTSSVSKATAGIRGQVVFSR